MKSNSYVLTVPEEYVEMFEAFLDLACQSLRVCDESKWTHEERKIIKAIENREWVKLIK